MNWKLQTEFVGLQKFYFLEKTSFFNFFPIAASRSVIPENILMWSFSKIPILLIIIINLFKFGL